MQKKSAHVYAEIDELVSIQGCFNLLHDALVLPKQNAALSALQKLIAAKRDAKHAKQKAQNAALSTAIRCGYSLHKGKLS